MVAMGADWARTGLVCAGNANQALVTTSRAMIDQQIELARKGFIQES